MLQESSLELKNYTVFSQHLKTWTCILSTDFNSVKTSVLRGALESLLHKLILTLKCVEYREFEEIIRFEVAIIQTVHVMGAYHEIPQFTTLFVSSYR